MPERPLAFALDWAGYWQRAADGSLEPVAVGRCTLRLPAVGVPAWRLFVHRGRRDEVQAVLTDVGTLLAASFPGAWLRPRCTIGAFPALTSEPGRADYTAAIDPGSGSASHPITIRIGRPNQRAALEALLKVQLPAKALRDAVRRVNRHRCRGRPPLSALERIVRAWTIHLEACGWYCRGRTRRATCVALGRAHGLQPGTISSMIPRVSEAKKFCELMSICEPQ